jgi:hypothetical protein
MRSGAWSRRRAPVLVAVAGALAAVLAGPLIGVGASALAAAVRPRVGVAFELAETSYRQEFSDAQIAEIEARGTEIVASRLGGRVGFVDYVVNDEAPYALEVSLDALDPTGLGIAREVGFHFALRGAAVSTGAKTYWTFRPREAWGEPIPEVEPLLEEIDRAFTGERADYAALVRSVLSQVRLSEACDLHPSLPSGWILPFTPEDICLDRGSILQIRHEVLSGGISAGVVLQARYSGETVDPDPSRRRLFCVPAAEEDRQLAAPLWTTPVEAVTATEVYLVEYEPLDAGCAQATELPTDVSFGGSP